MFNNFEIILWFNIISILVQSQYYNDQKQNCTNPNIIGSLCYNGPKFDEVGQYKSCSVPGVIAITFDDSPSEYTDYILDILKMYNMKATFNVIGKRIKIYPNLIQRIVDEGHQIASHTQNHVYLTDNETTINEMLNFEISLVRQNFRGVLSNSVIPNFMRAPHGLISSDVFNKLHMLGYTPIHWGFLTHDSNVITPLDVINNYKSHLGGEIGYGVLPLKISVITQQHDTEYETYASFAEVAYYLHRAFGLRGTKFVHIAECLGNITPMYRQNTRLQNDPNCSFGIKQLGICCKISCNKCGGSGCSRFNGGADNCCVKNILKAGYSCQISPAPCIFNIEIANKSNLFNDETTSNSKTYSICRNKKIQYIILFIVCIVVLP